MRRSVVKEKVGIFRSAMPEVNTCQCCSSAQMEGDALLARPQQSEDVFRYDASIEAFGHS